MDTIKINPRDLIVATYRDLAIQLAVVVGKTKDGLIRVRKYRSRCGRWTGTSTIYPTEVLRVVRRLRVGEPLPVGIGSKLR
jgi:hypothetical protein